jgi:hypothetical protein
MLSDKRIQSVDFIHPEQLGSDAFKKAYGIQFAYYAGAQQNLLLML